MLIDFTRNQRQSIAALHKLQDDFPPYTQGPTDNDPGRRSKCFKAVLSLVAKATAATSKVVKLGYLTAAAIVYAGCGIGNFHLH